jgi:hypothetical protein
MKVFMSWINAIGDIRTNTPNAKCPSCSNIGLSYQFIGDRKTKIGYVFVWCENCMKGIHISRTEIPEGVKVLPFDVSKEELRQFVPEFEIIE